jgi:bacillithiol synthase
LGTKPGCFSFSEKSSALFSNKTSLMNCTHIPLSQVGQFPTLLLDYLQGKPELTDFYGQAPQIANFEAQIQQKVFTPEKRQTLVAALRQQYARIGQVPDLEILLDEKTFTVTSGHQLNIFTGPLYVIYKIVTIINLARQLQAQYPEYRFVPVYWMASEDHDLAEISHFSLFGKTHTWETTQTGPVGRMTLQDMAPMVEALPESLPIFEEAYTQSPTLAQAVLRYMHALFGQHGLICLDPDEASLKKLFVPYIQKDLEGRAHALAVDAASERLEQLGYKTQISPRNINLFFMREGLRERFVFEDGRYKVLNTNLQFSQKEIEQLLEKEPQCFSPNVVLRPLYQEVILPNLAYIGGPSEVAYWLQLKGVFDLHHVPFPILMPRNFALVINKPAAKKIEKLGIQIADLFADEVTLRKAFVEKNSANALSLSDEQVALGRVFEDILHKAVVIDKTLESAVKAEQQKLFNGLENLEKRLKKAEERNQETEIGQLIGLKQKLFPGNVLQERSENFLNFYVNNPDFLDQLLTHFEPLRFDFMALSE